MKVTEQGYQIMSMFSDEVCRSMIGRIDEVARKCYQSEPKGEVGDLTRKLVKTGHHAMIEFIDITVTFITDRGVTHEFVRHRLCSFAQESTRYCKYGDGVEVILPSWSTKPASYYNDVEDWTTHFEDDSPYLTWWLAMCEAESQYLQLLEMGWSPQQARSVLPNSLKTELAVKANLREWLHIFKLRTSPKAHPQIKALLDPLLIEFKAKLPEVFEGV